MNETDGDEQMTMDEFFEMLPRCGPWMLVEKFEQNRQTGVRGYRAVIRAKKTNETPILHVANFLGHRRRAWIFNRKFHSIRTEGMSRQERRDADKRMSGYVAGVMQDAIQALGLPLEDVVEFNLAVEGITAEPTIKDRVSAYRRRLIQLTDTTPEEAEQREAEIRREIIEDNLKALKRLS